MITDKTYRTMIQRSMSKHEKNMYKQKNDCAGVTLD